MTPMTGRQLIMWDLAISLIAISSALMIGRLYARFVMLRMPGWDDYFAILGWVCLLAQASVEIAATYNGSGRDQYSLSENQKRTYFMLLPTAQLLYFLGTGFVRLSLLAFLPRLNKERVFMKWVFIVGGGITILSLGTFFTLLFECSPVKALWNKGMPGANCLAPPKEAVLMYTHSGLTIFFDLVLLIMPMWVLHKKMIFSVRTIKVALVFAVGIFTTIAGIIRLTTIVTINMEENTTYNVTFAAVWTNLEGHCGLWVACFPAIQPLVRRVSARLGLRPAAGSSKRSSNPTNKPPSAAQKHTSTRISTFVPKWIRHRAGIANTTSAPASGEQYMAFITTNQNSMAPPMKSGDTGPGTAQPYPDVTSVSASGNRDSDSDAADDLEEGLDHSEEEEIWENVDVGRPTPEEANLERGEELRVLTPRPLPLGSIMRTTVVTQDSEPRTSLYDRDCICGWREG